MTQDPRAVGGWFARLSPSGQHCLSTWIGDHDPALGRRKCASIIDGAIIHEDGYGGCWETDDTAIIYSYRHQGLVRWTIGDADVRPVTGPTRAGGNSLAAAAGRHIIGIMTPARTYLMWDDGTVIENAGSPTLSDDARHLAYLRASDKALVLDGEVIDAGPCDQPQFGDNTLAWEKNAQVFARSTPGQPTRLLSPPVPREFKPIPVWTGRDLPYLAHTDTGVHLRQWGSPRGWPVYDGITDGPHHARALDKTHVRCVGSVRGNLQQRVIDLDAGTIDLTPHAQPDPDPLPDIPFTVDPAGGCDDFLALLRPHFSGLSPSGHAGYLHKGSGDPDWGEWWDWTDRIEDGIGHLADNSGSGRMYFDGPRLFIPRKFRSGFTKSYVTDFRWTDTGAVDPGMPITITMDAGYGRYNGVEVQLRQTYSPRRRDPHNRKRLTGDKEHNYFSADGNLIRFEAYKDDANGTPVLIPGSVAQPWPVLHDGHWIEPPRPKPYSAILSTPPPENPMSLSVQQVIDAFRALPWDVDVAHLAAFRDSVWKRDQGGDVPSRGALAYYHRDVFAALVERFNQMGRLPGGPPAQVFAEWDQAFALGTQRAIARYRAEQAPDPEDHPGPPVDPGDPGVPPSGSHVQGPLSIRGVDFIDPQGQIFKWRGVAGFKAFQLWLDGERGQLDDFAGWAREFGANAWLFFCMWTGTGFDPRRYGARYYDEFPRFLEWQETSGFRPYPVLFCDQQPGSRSDIIMSGGEQGAHFNALRPHLIGRTARYMNEAYQNGIDLCRRLPHIDGALCARGQYSDDDTIESVGTVLDFSEKSFARKPQWARTAKDLEEIADATKKPGVGGEPPLGIFEATIPWSRSDDARGFADWHGTAELLGAGSFIHGDGSTVQACQRPGPRAQACAEAIAAMWRAGLPADGLSAGRYTRGGLGDCPLRHSDRYDDGDRELDPNGALRTFAVIQGNRATAIAIQTGPGWRPEADHGWTITRQYGPHGQLIDLTR